jgi:hypothetical protein
MTYSESRVLRHSTPATYPAGLCFESLSGQPDVLVKIFASASSQIVPSSSFMSILFYLSILNITFADDTATSNKKNKLQDLFKTEFFNKLY